MNNTRWLGKTHTIETKLKMSKVSPNKVGIIQLSLEGIYIRSWDSITEASANLSINPVSICQCCKGNYSKAGNFKWTYQ
jgi:hypothetical protein